MALVVTKYIANSAIISSKIADDAVITSKVQDLAIITSKLADSAVTEVKLAALSVSTAKLQALSVTTAKLDDLSVTSGKLAADSVITSKILDANVTLAKLASSSVDNSKVAAAAGIVESKLSLDYSTSSLNSDIQTRIPSSEKGANNGVATLDGGGKIPAAQLPNSVMEYKGSFDPTNTTLADGVGNAGDVYRASVAGSKDFGSGSISFAIGDMVIYSGSIWEKSPAADSVLSVNSQTGVVTLTTTHISEGSNLYFTDARARAAITILDSSSIDLSYSGGQISAAVLPAGVDHAALNNLDSASYSHISAAQKTDLTDGGESTLHYHDADRARANHTGTQLAATISDFASAAKSATVADSITDGVTDVAASQNAVFDALALKLPTSYLDTDGTLAANSDVKIASQKAVRTYVAAQIAAIPAAVSSKSEIITLISGDISAGYVDLAVQVPSNQSIVLTPKGGIMQEQGVDYTLSVVSSKTRVTFAGDLVSTLAAGDKLLVQYMS